MRQFISRFLQNNPGAPYYIKTSKLIDCLKSLDFFQYEALCFFCDKVAVSAVHQLLRRSFPFYRLADSGVEFRLVYGFQEHLAWLQMQSYLHLILSITMQHRLFFHGGGFGGKSRGRFTDPDENRQITSASLFTADIRSIINAPVNFKHRLILILVYGCGLRLGEQGVDLRYIQELLGHVSSTTTEIYTHVAAHKIVTIKSPVAGLSSQSG